MWLSDIHGREKGFLSGVLSLRFLGFPVVYFAGVERLLHGPRVRNQLMPREGARGNCDVEEEEYMAGPAAAMRWSHAQE